MKKYKPILLNIAFFLLGGLLFYLAFRKQNISALAAQLQKVNYQWGILVILVSLGTYSARTLRWQLLSRTLNLKLGFYPLFNALAFGYLVNLAIPRLGEISRCLILKKNLKAPFAPLFGTVITERVIDMLSLILIIGMALIFQSENILAFTQEQIWQPLGGSLQEKGMILIILGLIFMSLLGLLWWQRKYLLKWPVIQRVFHFLEQIWEGIDTIRHLPQVGLFLLYTLFIWIGYFLMSYLWFFSLPITQNISLSGALSIFVLGNLGRLVPTQGGGLGAYQLLVTQGFLLLGFAEVYGGTMAIVIHFTQIFYTLIMGGIAVLYFSYSKKQV